MSGKRDGVKGYKQIHLKRFSKTISHNLRLLALSRDLPLYELHDKIITDFIEDAEMIQQPPVIDQCGYNVFIGPKAQEQAAALSAKLKIPESEIFYSALFAFADRYKLSEPLDKVG
ncbi:hypothetical protein PZE02_003454 [Salmonella enterica subsp. enterica serovar Vitkin]|uniref:Uncharacterized protein n=3 Tax=Salmonella enterica TaxID=28901 RepID=A0A5Z6P5N6_SALET|nr:hypothetical protein [Salmonella enterica]EBG5369093.1 hypothetical protein [Salmonella enterica subsp. enterica serovar Monschaui]EBH8278976.1 hypothetical protein [Salmonella enterica subsp. enterica serovar Typhimurium str. UK-1]EBP3975267.1 hypothetical protein [Salmonella enterica subsp. enterica]EBS2690434.1 hypothetical protein [Salmonella enterica subsp. enterica serovar Muenchen]EBY0126218.1 hypothetical protein [Salmonella enterica subsp. enterica serovar Vitkin]EBY1916011.1 hypo